MSEKDYPYTIDIKGPITPSKCLLNSQEKSAFKLDNYENMFGKSVYDIVRAVA